MNLEQKLSLMVSEKDYTDCWKANEIPDFNSFFEILVDRVSKILPKEISNLSLKIEGSAEGRISVGGNFNSLNTEMRIWGQIVWLPKSNKFRGKLGTSEIKAPVAPPEDHSRSFILVNSTSRNLNVYGTSILIKPKELLKKFGSPPEGDNFKVSGMYIFEGNNGSAFRLHDYEATSLYWDIRKYPDFPSKSEFWASTEEYDFTVAGSHEASSFIEWLVKELRF